MHIYLFPKKTNGKVVWFGQELTEEMWSVQLNSMLMLNGDEDFFTKNGGIGADFFIPPKQRRFYTNQLGNGKCFIVLWSQDLTAPPTSYIMNHDFGDTLTKDHIQNFVSEQINQKYGTNRVTKDNIILVAPDGNSYNEMTFPRPICAQIRM